MLECSRLSIKNIEGISALTTANVLDFDIEAIRQQAISYHISEVSYAPKSNLNTSVSNDFDANQFTLVAEIIRQMGKARNTTVLMQQKGSKLLKNAVLASLNITQLNREKASNQYWLAYEHTKR